MIPSVKLPLTTSAAIQQVMKILIISNSKVVEISSEEIQTSSELISTSLELISTSLEIRTNAE